MYIKKIILVISLLGVVALGIFSYFIISLLFLVLTRILPFIIIPYGIFSYLGRNSLFCYRVYRVNGVIAIVGRNLSL